MSYPILKYQWKKPLYLKFLTKIGASGYADIYDQIGDKPWRLYFEPWQRKRISETFPDESYIGKTFEFKLVKIAGYDGEVLYQKHIAQGEFTPEGLASNRRWNRFNKMIDRAKRRDKEKQ